MSDLEARKAAWNEAVTELAEEYSQILQKIYDTRTAGDFTFLGVLGEYTRKIDELRAKYPHQGLIMGGPGTLPGVLYSNNHPGIPPAVGAMAVNQRERRRYLNG